MSWSKNKKKLENESLAMSYQMVGKTITEVSFTLAYPGHYSVLNILLDDGTKLQVTPNGYGCQECNPDGISYGIDVDVLK